MKLLHIICAYHITILYLCAWAYVEKASSAHSHVYQPPIATQNGTCIQIVIDGRIGVEYCAQDVVGDDRSLVAQQDNDDNCTVATFAGNTSHASIISCPVRGDAIVSGENAGILMRYIEN